MSAAIKTELTCKELVELVTDYLEDRLPLPERRRFELHLCTCTGCRIYLSQMRALLRACGRLAEEDLPAATRGALLATFREWKGA
jgi:predicted anti-sigma-YlaC factor YlaD